MERKLDQYPTRSRKSAITDEPMAWVLTMRDGKVARHRAFRSRSDALDAVGLQD